MSGIGASLGADGKEIAGAIEFAFYHSLVDDDPAHAAPALEALGRAAACWARVEHHIDALIIQVNKPQYDERLFEEHPKSFSKKIDLLKRWFNQYPPLSPYQEDMRYITSRLRLLASSNDQAGNITRNLLLHAIPASYDAETRSLVLHHLKMEANGDIRSRHITVGMQQLETFSELVQLVNKLLGLITSELFTAEGFAKLQRP